MLNVPGIVLVTIGLLFAIHALRVWLFSLETNQNIIIDFAFIPARYVIAELNELSPFAGYWSPLTYSFLHGDWTHIFMNVLWMLVFGGVVANRIGNAGFIMLFVLGSLGGAAAHYVSHPGELVPIVGASASVSAFMGAAIRFAFPKGQRFSMYVAHLPAQPLSRVFTNPQAMTFVAVWFVLNLVFGIGAPSLLAESPSIAWQAHIGGFVAGLLLFPFFDRRSTRVEE